MTEKLSVQNTLADSKTLRNALAQFATGVTVVTAASEKGDAFGITVNSFASASLQPPLIVWCLDRMSSQFDLFEAAEGFVVNVLSESQRDLCDQYATKNRASVPVETFERHSQYGPIITDCLAAFACSVEHRYDAGDHKIYVGRIEELATRNGCPLIFYGGDFHEIAEIKSL